MPGRIEHVEGVVLKSELPDYQPSYTVAGLRDLLAKFVGLRVSVVIEELDDQD